MSTKLILRALIASGLFVGAAVAFSPTAFAVTSDTVALHGTVASTLSIAATATSGPGKANALVLTGDGSNAITVKVADLAITTNNSTGYTLTATEGNLIDGHSDAIAYKVASVAHGTVTPPSGSDFSGSNGLYTDSTTTTAGQNDKDLYINYTPSATQAAGTYGATITLSVTDQS